MTESGLWIIVTGMLVSWIGALLGSFLMVRKMAMISDAISHAVLPGLVIAFMITGERDGFAMLLGAASFGLLASIGIQYLNQVIKLQTDASIGLVYTLLFSIGIILISNFASNTDLDADCILFGEIALVPMQTLDGVFEGIPQGVVTLCFGLIAIAAFVKFGYRGLQITSFDPEYAASIGISIAFWQYLLMGMVSVGTVISFESVGVILVVAFLSIPPATAYLLTKRLHQMIILALLFGTTASIGGYWIAGLFNTTISASMAVFAGLQFFLAFLILQILKLKKKTIFMG